jgi:hypothetical protein
MAVTGAGAAPNESIGVYFNGALQVSPTADSGGNFSTSFIVPNVASGIYTVSALGATLKDTGSVALQIMAAITVTPSSGPSGTPLLVTGIGMAPNESINLYINGALQSSTTADSGGNFSTSFIVPNVAPGAYGVYAIGLTSNGYGYVLFTITPH